ncbi:hypothetical protein GGX14DRAFT_167530 [Mycena pura]|uniref:Uncharacterized protein n=1 Tax=Mycena pura TaxID=153505 RepID=A0AAD6V631_9AGAR|nr:hypothetical protein GGX14DRAFT_167530 [Mycena pura]
MSTPSSATPDDVEGALRSFPQGEKAVLQVIDAPLDGSKPSTLSSATPSDVEGALGSLPQGEKAVLQVIDAPLDGSKPVVQAMFKLNRDIEQLKAEIAEGMKSLPPHDDKTARILDVTLHSDFAITGIRDTKGPESTRPARDVLIKFLQDTYTQPYDKQKPFDERRIFRWRNDPLPVNDIGSISSQWSQQFGGGDKHFYRLVNRISLQQDPLDYDLHPRDSYLTCAQDANRRLIVIIVNDVWSAQTFNMYKSRNAVHDIHFENPRIVPKMRDGKSWTSLSDGSLDTFVKLLLLDFFLASIYLQPVDYFGSLIWPKVSAQDELLGFHFPLTKNPHLQVPLGLFEPRLSAKSSESFKEIEYAEGILRSVNSLVDSIEFVLEALKPNVTADTFRRAADYERLKQTLEGLYKERSKNALRALEALNRQLDYLTKRHAIREAKSIKILTILAALYLPLSLSASLLGMSSPFKAIVHNQTAQTQDLTGTNLLFDFFGVFIWLATSTGFIVYGIRLALWLRSVGLATLAELVGMQKLSRSFTGPFSMFSYGKRWRFGGKEGRIFEMLKAVMKWWIGAGFYITLLVIFFVGMLRTAQEAWDTAWRLFAVYAIVGGSLFVCFFVLFKWLDRKKRRV